MIYAPCSPAVQVIVRGHNVIMQSLRICSTGVENASAPASPCTTPRQPGCSFPDVQGRGLILVLAAQLTLRCCQLALNGRLGSTTLAVTAGGSVSMSECDITLVGAAGASLQPAVAGVLVEGAGSELLARRSRLQVWWFAI